jgi:hypothetical protein
MKHAPQPDSEARIDAKRREIKLAMGALGRELEKGNERELLHWIIPGQLACAHRPLRYHARYGGSRARLSPDATPLIQEWVELIKIEGIKSIISLWHDRDTACYRSLPLGNGDLLTYLESEGFMIKNHPYEDPAHKRTPPAIARENPERIRAEALESYDQLPKPVLIQCSAGQDRSAPVAAYIHAQRTPKN